MLLKRINVFLPVLLSIFLCKPVDAQQTIVTMDKVQLTFILDQAGRPSYSVAYNQKVFIAPSLLGFKLLNDVPLDANFELLGTEKESVDSTWKPVWGEVSTIRDHYEQLTAHLKQRSTGHCLDIVFRVFADGVGFRYEFPKQPGLDSFIVTDELTQFSMTDNHRSFWIPGDYDTNEYPYTTCRLSDIDNKDVVTSSTEILVRDAPDRYAVQTPFMMKSDDGLYINIHEAALVNYPAMQLHVNISTYQLTASLVPDSIGNKAHLTTPCHTPWRTIIVSDNAPDILASKMILNLNEPCAIANTSWIKPMKFVGVWWEIQTGKGSWNYTDHPESRDSLGQLIPNGRHSANTKNVKRYIDFAAANGIQGVLVEGWNVGWEDWFGKWKEDVFDFVTPYPDFNTKEIEDYAAKKGVQMIMHHETSGSATGYERQMDTAFRYMKEYGYNYVKTGYVGKIIPRGEHHDGQWMVNSYIRSVVKAASYEVMVDMHEPVRPTGLQRTYPNWLACEAARGNEYFAFSNGNAIDHETILPFTRLMGGPMDYTPGIFKLSHYTMADTNRRFRSTICKQLALYVVMYSPLVMAADLPENYEAHMDAFQFIKDVPVDWDDTKILAAEPGDYIVTARKQKESSSWFLGAITDDNSRLIKADLSFLDKGKKYEATIYGDADDADWLNNPEAYTIKKQVVTSKTKLSLVLARGGGAAVSIVEIKKPLPK
jgi:glucan 1,4-alpha-glucosidase